MCWQKSSGAMWSHQHVHEDPPVRSLIQKQEMGVRRWGGCRGKHGRIWVCPRAARSPLLLAADNHQQNCLIKKLMYTVEDNFILKIILLSYCYLLQVKLFTYKMHSSNTASITPCSCWKLSGSWTKADNIAALVLWIEKERQRVKVIPRVKWQVSGWGKENQCLC